MIESFLLKKIFWGSNKNYESVISSKPEDITNQTITKLLIYRVIENYIYGFLYSFAAISLMNLSSKEESFSGMAGGLLAIPGICFIGTTVYWIYKIIKFYKIKKDDEKFYKIKEILDTKIYKEDRKLVFYIQNIALPVALICLLFTLANGSFSVTNLVISAVFGFLMILFFAIQFGFLYLLITSFSFLGKLFKHK